MEFVSFDKKDRILSSLQQIEKSILLLQDWNKNLQSVDDYLLSAEGVKNLATSCMLIEAIGEAYKKIDNETIKDNLSPLLEATRLFIKTISE